MAKINQVVCAQAYGNTGTGECDFDPEKIIISVQVTEDFEVGEEEAADFLSFMRGLIHAPIGKRVFPGPKYINLQADNTEDLTINTTDYGAKTRGSEGYYDWVLRYRKGGVMLHQNLQLNDGSNKYFIHADSDGNVLFYLSGGKLKGIPTEEYIVDKWRLATGAESAIYTVRFITDPIYLNKGNLGFLKVDFNMFDLKGLQDVKLSLVEQVGNVLTVQAHTKVGNVNLYGKLSAKLASVNGWQIVNKETGDSIGIQTVAVNATAGAAGDKGAWDITIESSDFIELSDGDTMSVRLAESDVLYAAPFNIEGYEVKPDDALDVVVEAGS